MLSVSLSIVLESIESLGLEVDRDTSLFSFVLISVVLLGRQRVWLILWLIFSWCFCYRVMLKIKFVVD